MRVGVNNAGELHLGPEAGGDHVVLHTELGRELHVQPDPLRDGLGLVAVVSTADVLPGLVPRHLGQLEHSHGAVLLQRDLRGEVSQALLGLPLPGEARPGAARHSLAPEPGALPRPHHQPLGRSHTDGGRN